MKKFNDIISAQNDYLERRDEFLELNYKFYLNLIGQIGTKGQIPNGGLIKYQKGTDKNINIVEEWINSNDDGSCSMIIGIIANGIIHNISFLTQKDKSIFTLDVQGDINNRQFNYDLTNKNIEDLNFDEVVDYIFVELSNHYDKLFER